MCLIIFFCKLKKKWNFFKKFLQFLRFFALKIKTKTANLSENDYTVQTSFGKNAKFGHIHVDTIPASYVCEVALWNKEI